MGLLLLAIGFSLSSCGKDSDDLDPQSSDSALTMKIDGQSWGSTVHTLFTDEMEHEQFGEYYHVMVAGQRLSPNDSEEDVSGLNLYIIVPKSKFNNPKGTYKLMMDSEMKVGDAGALFTDAAASGHSYYVSYDPNNHTQSVGTVTITDFEIGIQTVAGQSTDKEGYTKMAGNFQMTLHSMDGDGKTLRITDGKFNMNVGIGVDF